MKRTFASIIAVLALGVAAPLGIAGAEEPEVADEDLSRPEARQGAREGEQDARHEAREGRRDARGEGPEARGEARREGREGRQDARQSGREGRREAR